MSALELQGVTQLSFLPPAPEAPAGESDEFYTLRQDFDPWHHEFRFTVDACALNAEAAKLPRFYSPEQDGLKQDYRGERVWCNLPFSEAARWIGLADHWMRNGCDLWVCLLPQNRQEQGWWHAFIEPFRDCASNRIRDERGRVVLAGQSRPFTLETRNLKGRRRFGYPGSPDSPEGGAQPRTGHLLAVWRATP